jgi:hypothetical protein
MSPSERKHRSPRIALICSAHGFGHVTRQLALAESMVALGHSPVLFTAAPEAIARAYLPEVRVQPWVVDVGLVQPDGLREDVEATAARLEAVCSEAAIDALAGALVGFDRAVVDCAPAALEACRRAGVPALAVGNFDWAWIYRHYPPLAAWAERFATWQAPHRAVALKPGPGMSGFAAVEPWGVLGRKRRPHRAGRPGERTVLVSFGGFGLSDLEARLPRIPGVRYLLAPPLPRLDRPDVSYIEGVAYPALVAGADAVFTKPGYGILAEASLAATRLVWVDRGVWPEAPYLELAMWERGDIKVGEDGLAAALEKAWSWPPPPPIPDSATLSLARRVLRGR